MFNVGNFAPARVVNQQIDMYVMSFLPLIELLYRKGGGEVELKDHGWRI